ncbi:MAG: DNA translocase FtsK 4TM domain-containing protein, partial [Actinomycetota bacterium]
MTTWGASSRRSKKTAKKHVERADRRAANDKSSTKSGRKNAGSVRDATPPDGSRSKRDRASDELRDAVDGREHEFLGLALIGVAILLGLAMYVDLAGPVGRGVETLIGWLTGLARFAVPVVLAAAGVALVRRGRTSSPIQLAVGWSIAALGVLGLLHIVRGPEGFSADTDELESAGGILGALVAWPIEALVGPIGAGVVLVVALAGGLLLVTRTSLRTLAENTGGFLAAVGRPLGRAAKSGLSNITTLASDREHEAPEGEAPPPVPGETTLYDFAADGDDFGEAPKKKRASRKKAAAGAGAAAAGRTVAADGGKVGEWTLPPITFLGFDTEEAGRTLPSYILVVVLSFLSAIAIEIYLRSLRGSLAEPI